MSEAQKLAYEFDVFRLETKKRRLLKNNEALLLSTKAIEILQVLVENRDRVVGKDELLQQVWPDTFVEEANLTVNISALRKALGESKNDHRFITTISGRGYRFVGDVREITEEAALEPGNRDAPTMRTAPANVHSLAGHLTDGQGATAETDLVIAQHTRVTISGTRPANQQRISPPRRYSARRMLIAILAFVVVTALVLVLTRTILKRTEPVAEIKSIAVLPFRPIIAESANESLEMGMADTLITKFSSTGRIVVRPLSAVRKYGADNQDTAAAGRELGVDAILEGTIQPNSGRVRITVRLINSRTGLALWADKFDERLDDIFIVQDRVSEKVAQALTVRLTTDEEVRLAKHPTNNAEAYQAYLQGRFFWNKRTLAGYKRAMEFFDEALKLDPGFALAYSGLADCHLLRSEQLPPSETMLKAKEASQKALALDNSLAEAYTSLARVKQFYDWDWNGAEQDFARAISIDPNYPTAHHWYAQYLMDLGRQEDAIKEIHLARDLDPTSLIINTDVGSIFQDVRQYDQAIAVYRSVIDMDPTFARAHLELGRALTQQRRYDEAIAEIQRATDLADRTPRMLTALAYVYAVAGKGNEARKLIDEVYRMQNLIYVSPYSVALVYAGLGDKEHALELLEKAYADRFGLMAYLKIEPRFDSLRKDARFVDLIRRVGLPQ